MSLTERDIYERVARGEVSVEEAMRLLAGLDAGTGRTEELGDAPRASADTAAGGDFEARVLRFLEERLRRVLQLTGELPVDRGFMNLGASSASLLGATRELERELGVELFPTIFFEHGNLAALAAYFTEHHADRMRELVDTRPAAPSVPREQVPAAPRLPAPVLAPSSAPARERGGRSPGPVDIAIVGVSGRYPGARNVREFWRVLAEGRDCITEIPKDRWDHSRYFAPDREKPYGTYSKWGGFLDDVDKFDALFFNISPREAELLDPQERLFLETAWGALEDAGYTRVGMRRGGIRSEEVGVFVGVMWSNYQLYGAEDARLGRGPLPVSAHWSIANRVSYFFDLQGPSMAVDTACSSSLTALHLACESLRTGDCRLAIAGGVNLSTHPYKYLALSQGRFVSSDGRCRSFGAGGDGYVPGEGVGAVVLRTLEDAERDGDHIYAVIKGTAINHGGHANGFTVPNPNAQAALIRRALERSGVEPSTISYIEAHGTGTALGDPIEIAGLSQAFREHLAGRDVFPIGSVKSNIGHLESAAGIAGLTKVLLQLEHRTLVPSLHSTPANPHIDFASTPFQVVREAQEWRRPARSDGGEVPRRAAVSSFGAGGSNGHVIVEEYLGTRRSVNAESGRRELVLLSAKDRERLREHAAQHLALLSEAPPPLVDLAYTLRVAREAMPERLALLVRDHDELRAKLAAFVERGELAEGVYAGTETGAQARLRGADAEDQAYVRMLFDAGKLERLASFWTSGSEIDWSQLRASGGQRVPLPTYPFARERHWLEEVPGGAARVTPEPRTDTEASAVRPSCLVREWHVSPLSGAPVPLSNRRLVILHDASAPESLRQALATLVPEPLRVIEVGRVSRAAASGRPSLDRDDLDAGLALAREVLTRARDVEGVLDLCDLTRADDGGRVEYGRIGFYQGALAERGAAPFLLLHVTAGLLSGETLAGAPLHGLVTAIAGEYRGVTARSIDVEHGDLDPEHLFALLAAEAARGAATSSDPLADERQVRYRNGQREVPTLREVPLSPGLSVTSDRAYVVSGGTRGLGAAFARLLVERGARRLALLGAQALPPRSEWARVAGEDSSDGQKVRAIQELEARGATVLLYTGRITDRAALRRFFGEVRAKLGPVGGVLHCAGAVSDESPAFLHKTRRGFERVLEPKLEGTHVLADLLEDERPDFFVLFSSVSAVIPGLAVGLSDYALANAFLDRFAEVQHQRGRTWFRSFNWPSFRDTGFGEATTDAYRKAGLATLTVEQGFALLDGALGIAGAPVVLPCIGTPVLAPLASEVSASVPTGRSTRPELLAAATLSDSAMHPLSGPSVPASRERATPPASVARATVSAGATQSRAEKREQQTAASRGDGRAAAYAALVHIFSTELKLAPERFRGDVRFEEYGADSVLIASAVKRIEKVVGAAFEPGLLLEHPTLDSLSSLIAERYPASFAAAPPMAGAESATIARPAGVPLASGIGTPIRATPAEAAHPSPARGLPNTPALTDEPAGSVPVEVPHPARVSPATSAAPGRSVAAEATVQSIPIAIVGIACRFPGAEDKDRFWDNLARGECSIREVPRERWESARFYSPEPGPGRTNSKWGGFIDGIDLFDPAYFRIHESLAPLLDPLQRLMLETSLLATLDAGYSRDELSNRRVGVYVGTRVGNYMSRVEQPEKATIVGIGQNFIGARISDYFNWRGNNVVIDSACSSSLVSVHLACQALREREVDAALAGGVDILLDEVTYLTLSAAGALSPDGRCHTFDERANGFVPGEGVGALMLKRLDDALRDGDRVYAVIRGSAVNNDGRTMGITTPNMEAQIEVIEAALAKSGLSPADLSYVEAHGTGTMIGDPIELKALATVFRRETDARGFCAVGSVKTNIGHLLSAAGVAGLVKLALSLDRKLLPPTLHCERPNPRFAFDQSPFYVNRELRPWELASGQRRRAGISAFGFGGTNCHMILEEHAGPYEPRRTPLPAPAFNKRSYLLPARRWNDTGVPIAAAPPPSNDAPLLRFEPLASVPGDAAPVLRFEPLVAERPDRFPSKGAKAP
ncbi:KR domain-containing protein [Pyxidicoccus fallax]|uniref:KR domain-containing protein n=1 Tax=Pyxidicoccus fallax TaxID=394095 RepID=A0A848LCP2_9BACT|nr:beta-ketoacyl synthase N-terminal-like domain-containing protein [Pyxidicoccus fallax]NMO14585.1 KR domain-containing protein [Pyxidicoccus fallax]NPC78924.1 KR domain-containing protein [Pyxidicoccus fallax]